MHIETDSTMKRDSNNPVHVLEDSKILIKEYILYIGRRSAHHRV